MKKLIVTMNRAAVAGRHALPSSAAWGRVALPVIAFAVICGCSTPGQLKEPAEIPQLVQTYKIDGLGSKTGDVPVALDLEDCVERAVMVSKGMTGGSSVAGNFPVRGIVEREFQKVIVANFRTVMPDEQPKMTLHISSNSIRVMRSWSKVNCEMEFDIELVDPATNRKPYFRKRYHKTSEAITKHKDEIPACIYSCLQHVAEDFIRDVSKNRSLTTLMREMGER